ncbi:MAG: MFS transporter, partial [Actinomycetia bacterium]|nr:MFS transporter [Actinomycetes bacterium]
MTSPPRLLTPRFLVLCAAVSLYFLGLNMTLSVLPLFVEGTLGGTSTQVGLAVSSFGLSAAVIRPLVGPIGDRRGRRILVTTGAIAAGVATMATATADTIPMVVLFRIIAGLGEAAVFVGAASAIQDMTPDDRRAESASYYSLTIYGSLFIGPPLGEWISEAASTDTAWVVAGALAVCGGLIGLSAPGAPADPPPRPEHRILLHRAALRPGIVLFFGLLGYTGFLAFAALHAADVGVANTGTVFTMFAAVVIVMRIFAAKLPDRLGPITTSRISLSCAVVGLLTLWAWQEPAGLYVGAAVMAIAQSFLFPALFALVVDQAPGTERSHAIGTFSMFFDLAFGFGGPLIGVVA